MVGLPLSGQAGAHLKALGERGGELKRTVFHGTYLNNSDLSVPGTSDRVCSAGVVRAGQTLPFSLLPQAL